MRLVFLERKPDLKSKRIDRRLSSQGSVVILQLQSHCLAGIITKTYDGLGAIQRRGKMALS